MVSFITTFLTLTDKRFFFYINTALSIENFQSIYCPPRKNIVYKAEKVTFGTILTVKMPFLNI